jgi:hypothetical protein
MTTMPPVSLRPTAATKTTLAFVWDAPETGTPPTSYEVRVNGGSPVDVGLVNIRIQSSLTPATAYQIGVRAISADGPSAWVTRTMETVAFLREHFYRAVRNGKGELQVGATVAIFKAGTTETLATPIYVESTGNSEHGPAWLLDEGIIDFYLEVPQIVDIHVTVPNRATPMVFPHQYVGDILDVDLTNDTVMTAIDFDANTQFRQQQDARHAAAYASKATQTAVETGRLTKANLDADYAAKSTQTTVETGRLTVANLDTAYKAPLDAHVAAGADAHDASAISVTPAGNLSATDVQGALAELDAEKATPAQVGVVATALADHLADASDAHDASAISVAPAGNLAATDVQAALAELDTEKASTGALSDHINDAADAHDASAISFSPAGNLAATDVQAALAELDTEKATPAQVADAATVVAAAADFGDDAHAVNTAGKVAGRPGFDSTGNRPVWASGATPTSTWVYADGTTAFTPA